MKKKILLLFLIIFIIIITIFVIIIIPPIKNKSYEKKIYEDIYSNTDYENITYLNKDNNYYIIKKEDKVVVLDLNYEVVFTKDSIRESNLPLVYKRNNLYYEEKITDIDKITYNYYSTDEDTIAFSSVIGGF